MASLGDIDPIYTGSTLGQAMTWRHQCITWTSVGFSSVWSSDNFLVQFQVSLKIIYLKSNWNLPGANELMVQVTMAAIDIVRFFCTSVVKLFTNKGFISSITYMALILPAIFHPLNHMYFHCHGDNTCTLLMSSSLLTPINTLGPRQDGRHFPDDIFKWIFVDENACLKFHWNLFLILASNWQQSSIGLYNGLAPHRRQASIWPNADPIHWPIYATLGGDELTPEENDLRFADEILNAFY